MIKTSLISNRKLQTSNIELQRKREGWSYKLNFCDQGGLIIPPLGQLWTNLNRKSIWFWNIIEKIQIFINLHSFLVFVVGKRNLIFLLLVTTESRNTIRRGSVYRHVSGLYQPHTGGRWWRSCKTFILHKTELYSTFFYCVFNWKLFGLKFISFSWTL